MCDDSCTTNGWVELRHTLLAAHVFIRHLSLLSTDGYQACHPPSTHAAPGTHRANCPLPTHSLLGPFAMGGCARAHHNYVFLLRAPSIATLANVCVRQKVCGQDKVGRPVNTSVLRLGAHFSGCRGTLVANHSSACLFAGDCRHNTQNKAVKDGHSRRQQMV